MGIDEVKGKPDGAIQKKVITLDGVQTLVKSLLDSSGIDILVGTTGSSGRQEEYSDLDELELLLYPGEEVSSDDLRYFQDTLKRYSGRNCSLIFEEKTLEKPEFFEGVEGGGNGRETFFPSRFVDFTILRGEEDEYDELIGTFLGSIKHHSGKVIDGWKKRIAVHRKVSEKGLISWKGEEIPLFDDTEKMLHYSKEIGGREVSIKIGALRYIQYKIVQMLMVLIRQGKIDVETFRSIGKSVDSKIDFLSDVGVKTSMIQLQELKGLYAFFLGIHNNMSKAFHKDGSGSMVFLDEDYSIFKERLIDFNRLMGEFNLK